MTNPESAASQQQLNIWVRWLPVISALLLVAACALARWTPVELPGGELFWKIAYGWFLGSSLLVLWPSSSRWLSGRLRVFAPGRSPDAWWWFDVILFTYTVVALTQYLVPLPRPPQTSLPGLGGFPSGHQVSCWGLVWLVWRTVPRLSVMWFGLAIFIGWARIATHDHYAYQVLGGAAVGIVVGWGSERWREGVLLPRLWHWSRQRWKKFRR